MLLPCRPSLIGLQFGKCAETGPAVPTKRIGTCPSPEAAASTEALIRFSADITAAEAGLVCPPADAVR